MSPKSSATFAARRRAAGLCGVLVALSAGVPWDANLNKKPVYHDIATALGGTGSPSASAPASASASRTTGGSSTCHVTFQVTSQWNTGFGVNVTIANNGSSTRRVATPRSGSSARGRYQRGADEFHRQRHHM